MRRNGHAFRPGPIMPEVDHLPHDCLACSMKRECHQLHCLLELRELKHAPGVESMLSSM